MVGQLICKIWYSISQTVSDLRSIYDRSIRAFAVKPRAGMLRPTIECTLLRTCLTSGVLVSQLIELQRVVASESQCRT